MSITSGAYATGFDLQRLSRHGHGLSVEEYRFPSGGHDHLDRGEPPSA